MNTHALQGDRDRELVIAAILAAILALSASWIYMRATAEPRDAMRTSAVASGFGIPPFQYRILSPLALSTAIGRINAPRQTVEFGFYALAFFALFLGSYRYLRDGFSHAAGVISMFSAFYMMCVNSIEIANLNLVGASNYGVRFSHDITHPVFMLLLVGAILNRSRAVWYCVFALGTFNRETTLYLLPALFLIWGKRDGYMISGIHAVISAVIWINIKLALRELFGGSIASDALASNLSVLSGSLGLAPIIQIFAAFGGCYIFAAIGWRRLNFDGRVLCLIYPAAMVPMFFMASLLELRIHNDFLPMILPAVVAGLSGERWKAL